MDEKNKTNKELIQDSLIQVNYWLVRYEQSRNVHHLDVAIRHANGIRPYLPSSMREMGLFQLANIGFYMKPSLQGDTNDG